MKLIKNTTPYIGKIYLKLEKYPGYEKGGNSDFLNKIHLDLGFTKLVSRIKTKTSLLKDGYNVAFVRPEVIHQINYLTGGQVGTYYFPYPDKSELPFSFLTLDGKTYIGSIKDGWWYVKKGFRVDNRHPHGVAIKVLDFFKDLPPSPIDGFESQIEGYYGYSHRGGGLFKIGDRLFDEMYEPKEEDYPEWQWAGFVQKYEEGLADAIKRKDDFDLEDIARDGISRYIPFRLRGNKEIENWEEAFQAAKNMSKYLS